MHDLLQPAAMLEIGGESDVVQAIQGVLDVGEHLAARAQLNEHAHAVFIELLDGIANPHGIRDARENHVADVGRLLGIRRVNGSGINFELCFANRDLFENGSKTCFHWPRHRSMHSEEWSKERKTGQGLSPNPHLFELAQCFANPRGVAANEHLSGRDINGHGQRTGNPMHDGFGLFGARSQHRPERFAALARLGQVLHQRLHLPHRVEVEAFRGDELGRKQRGQFAQREADNGVRFDAERAKQPPACGVRHRHADGRFFRPHQLTLNARQIRAIQHGRREKLEAERLRIFSRPREAVNQIQLLTHFGEMQVQLGEAFGVAAGQARETDTRKQNAHFARILF